MDLERTLISGVPAYWKRNRIGYTYDIQHAGIFLEDEAKVIVDSDRNQTTIKVPVKLAIKLLGEDLKINESC